MGKVIYLQRPRELDDVEHLLDLCREIELRARRLDSSS